MFYMSKYQKFFTTGLGSCIATTKEMVSVSKIFESAPGFQPCVFAGQ